jgi:drug/metabolite transporter (DMT)-like permease
MYYGVFLTYLSFILWFTGLKYVSASVAGVFTALIPVSGVLLSMLFLGETPSTLEFFGGVLIILSIILVVYKNENK